MDTSFIVTAQQLEWFQRRYQEGGKKFNLFYHCTQIKLFSAEISINKELANNDVSIGWFLISAHGGTGLRYCNLIGSALLSFGSI